jgi:hypothetical protein
MMEILGLPGFAMAAHFFGLNNHGAALVSGVLFAFFHGLRAPPSYLSPWNKFVYAVSGQSALQFLVRALVSSIISDLALSLSPSQHYGYLGQLFIGASLHGLWNLLPWEDYWLMFPKPHVKRNPEDFSKKIYAAIQSKMFTWEEWITVELARGRGFTLMMIPAHRAEVVKRFISLYFNKSPLTKREWDLVEKATELVRPKVEVKGPFKNEIDLTTTIHDEIMGQRESLSVERIQYYADHLRAFLKNYPKEETRRGRQVVRWQKYDFTIDSQLEAFLIETITDFKFSKPAYYLLESWIVQKGEESEGRVVKRLLARLKEPRPYYDSRYVALHGHELKSFDELIHDDELDGYIERQTAFVGSPLTHDLIVFLENIPHVFHPAADLLSQLQRDAFLALVDHAPPSKRLFPTIYWTENFHKQVDEALEVSFQRSIHKDEAENGNLVLAIWRKLFPSVDFDGLVARSLLVPLFLEIWMASLAWLTIGLFDPNLGLHAAAVIFAGMHGIPNRGQTWKQFGVRYVASLLIYSAANYFVPVDLTHLNWQALFDQSIFVGALHGLWNLLPWKKFWRS